MVRMLISEKVHNALLAEGMVRGEKPGAILEDLVMGGISQKARTILETLGQDTPPTTKATRLSDDLATQERIREMWAAGGASKADIAREVGYSHKTVSAWIRSNLESGGES